MPRQPRSCMQRLLMGFVVLLTLGICSYVFLAVLTDSAGDAARATLKPSRVVEQYKEWSRPPVESAPANTGAAESPPPPRPASFDAFTETREFYKQRIEENTALRGLTNHKGNNPKWLEDQDMEKTRELCASNQDLIAKIRALAAMGGPLIPFEFTLFGEEIYDSKRLLHYYDVRGMSRILYMDSIVQARNGSCDEAVENILAIMRLGDALAQEPFIRSQKVRCELYGLAVQTLTAVFAPGELSQEQSSRIIAQIRKVVHRGETVEAIRGEMTMVCGLVDRIRAGGFDSQNYPAFDSIILQASLPLINLNETTYINFLNTILELAGKPYYEIFTRCSMLEDEIENLSFIHVVTQKATTQALSILTVQASHEVLLGLTETGLLAELQAAQTGAAPDSIAFVGAAAVDPYIGKPFVFKPAGSSFILYSLGGNQKDDDGLQKGDIVWRGE